MAKKEATQNNDKATVAIGVVMLVMGTNLLIFTKWSGPFIGAGIILQTLGILYMSGAFSKKAGKK